MTSGAACGVVAGAALTVDRGNVIEGGHRFEVRCDEPETHTWTVPAGAQRVEVLEPVAGQAVTDGFGDLRVATIRDVVTRTEPDGGAWLTTGVTVRARYHVVSDEPVLVSDDQAGMHAASGPARLTANADAGWRGLHWRSWGGASAVARGTFNAMRWIPIGYTDVVQRRFSYYTRIETRFLSAVPREVRRQAKPPGTASCLRALPGA